MWNAVSHSTRCNGEQAMKSAGKNRSVNSKERVWACMYMVRERWGANNRHCMVLGTCDVPLVILPL